MRYCLSLLTSSVFYLSNLSFVSASELKLETEGMMIIAREQRPLGKDGLTDKNEWLKNQTYIGTAVIDNPILEEGSSEIVAENSCPVPNPAYSSIALSPDGYYLFIANGHSKTLSILDTQTNEIITTLAFSHDATYGAFETLRGDCVYVTAIVPSKIILIEYAGVSAHSSITLYQIEEGLSMVSSSDHKYVYVFNHKDSLLNLIDVNSYATVKAISINAHNICSEISIYPTDKMVPLSESSEVADNAPRIELPESPAKEAIEEDKEEGNTTIGEASSVEESVVIEDRSPVQEAIPKEESQQVEIRAELLPPKDFAGKRKQNNFGVVKEYYNELFWQPSESKIEGYILYRNGTLIAKLSSNTLSYQDRNRRPSQVDTYSLFSFNLEGLTSSSVTITIKGN